MPDTRVGRVALVVIAQRLARAGIEHGVWVVVGWLEQLERIAVRRDAIRVLAVGRIVDRVDLLAQRQALQRAVGLLFLLRRQHVRKRYLVRQRYFLWRQRLGQQSFRPGVR